MKHLKDRRLLLVLDNFEQDTATATNIGTLLMARARLTVLVTSRIRLGLRGDREFPLPALVLPNPKLKRLDHMENHPDHGTTQIIVLNGGFSSGKTGIGRCLQAILPQPWIRLGVDDLLDALPPSLMETRSGVAIGPQGEIALGDDYRAIEAAWLTGIAAMARAGAWIIIEDVFLGGDASQARLRRHLKGLEVLWVGVRCDPEQASSRELNRGDRVIGMAASQAQSAHQDVVYDLEVDTTRTESLECARIIAAHVT